MRELNLLETGYLGGLLVLSLVLPLLLGRLSPTEPGTKKRCLYTVWTGQILGALAGLVILFSAPAAPYAAAAGILICLGFAVRLLQQNRTAFLSSAEI